MTKAENIEIKKEKAMELGKIFDCDGVYLIDYRGLNVLEIEDLRNRIKRSNANFKVIKNRLAIKFFEMQNKEYEQDMFRGPVAVAYTNENFIEVAKVIVDFEKEIKKIKIKSGFIERKFVDKDKILDVAKLPGKDQLMNMLAFSMLLPLKKFGLALSAPLRNLLILMKNLEQKKAKEEKNNG